jgi:tetratricopeptide (TPR) repeat protein
MMLANRLMGIAVAVAIIGASPLAVRAGQVPPLQTASTRIERAYHHGDTAALADIVRQLQAQRGRHAKYADYYLGYAYYALVQLEIGRDDDKADADVDKAEAALKAALKASPGFAEARALLAATYGLEIGLHPFHGVWLGSRIGKQMDRAQVLSVHNPRITLIRGISDYFTPSAFGGDRSRARREFAQAIKQFDAFTSPNALAPTWGKAEAYALLAEAEADAHDKTAAKRDYQAALQLAPGYKAAKKGLAALGDPVPASSATVATPASAGTTTPKAEDSNCIALPVNFSAPSLKNSKPPQSLWTSWHHPDDMTLTATPIAAAVDASTDIRVDIMLTPTCRCAMRRRSRSLAAVSPDQQSGDRVHPKGHGAQDFRWQATRLRFCRYGFVAQDSRVPESRVALNVGCRGFSHENAW